MVDNTKMKDAILRITKVLRDSRVTAESKHLVLGLVFLKHISDTKDDALQIPPEARWSYIERHAGQPAVGEIPDNAGEIIDKAMEAIEHYNPSLRGVLPRGYGQPFIDKNLIGKLIDCLGSLVFGNDEASSDVLGRIYEYLLDLFARTERSKGGLFYTPRCIVRLLVEMLKPFDGVVYDPCCGSGGMFVQSAEFIRARAQISIYGQELNYTAWRLAKMNLAIHGIDGKIEQGDTFHHDRFPDLKADFILANPPFNMKEWGGERLREDKRWKFGVPPVRNANFAWVQHIIHHLAPTGVAGFVLANGSMSSNQSGEGEIRKNIIEADLVDCMVALPDRLFYTTMIQACLWFVRRGKRIRQHEVLFIDARNMGTRFGKHRELTDDEIARIARTYHAWRGEPEAGTYADVPGFCKSATLDEIRQHGHVLTPGRYVGAAPNDEEDDGEPFEQKMQRLVAELRQQQAEARRLDEAIWKNLKELGYGG